MGGCGAGYTTKLLVNLLWFGQAIATAEALLLARREDIDLELMQRALAGSAASSSFIRHLVRPRSVLRGTQRDHRPGPPGRRAVRIVRTCGTGLPARPGPLRAGRRRAPARCDARRASWSPAARPGLTTRGSHRAPAGRQRFLQDCRVDETSGEDAGPIWQLGLPSSPGAGLRLTRGACHGDRGATGIPARHGPDRYLARPCRAGPPGSVRLRWRCRRGPVASRADGGAARAGAAMSAST